MAKRGRRRRTVRQEVEVNGKQQQHIETDNHLEIPELIGIMLTDI